MSDLWDRFVAALVDVWQFAYGHAVWLVVGALVLMVAWALFEALRPNANDKK